MSAPSVTFTVLGVPVPAGSKRAFIVRPKVGRERVAVVDTAGARGKTWRQDVQFEARRHFQRCFEGPLRLRMTFILPRPKGHYRANGTLRPTAPTHPIGRPDTTKLVRGLEDALTWIAWADDAQVVEQTALKVYGAEPAAVVTVSLIEPARAAGATVEAVA